MIVVDVVHELDPPPVFSYTLAHSTVIKAYAQAGFRLNLIATNRAKSDCLIHSLSLATIEYANHLGRIVELERPKGFFEPIKVAVSPSIQPGSEVDVLGGKVWQIGGRAVELIQVTLARATVSGLYTFQFRVKAHLDGRAVSMSSAALTVLVPSQEEDVLRLKVAGRHYDSPIEALLKSSTEDWDKLQGYTARLDEFIYLGPTPVDVVRGVTDQQWLVRSLPVTDDGSGRKIYSSDTQSRIVHPLGIPVEEELFSVAEAGRRIFGKTGREGLLVRQVRRKGNK
jgi:hypothetical protein